MGDFTLNVRQKPMDFNRWQLGLSICVTGILARFVLDGSPDQYTRSSPERRYTRLERWDSSGPNACAVESPRGVDAALRCSGRLPWVVSSQWCSWRAVACCDRTQAGPPAAWGW